MLGGARRCLCATLRSFCGVVGGVVGGGSRWSAVLGGASAMVGGGLAGRARSWCSAALGGARRCSRRCPAALGGHRRCSRRCPAVLGGARRVGGVVGCARRCLCATLRSPLPVVGGARWCSAVVRGARWCLCATLRSLCGGWRCSAVVRGGPRCSAVVGGALAVLGGGGSAARALLSIVVARWSVWCSAAAETAAVGPTACSVVVAGARYSSTGGELYIRWCSAVLGGA